jgi:hypothetical protein
MYKGAAGREKEALWRKNTHARTTQMWRRRGRAT